MELKEFRETLSDLENNLLSLESARKQVERVTQSSDELTVTTRETLTQINILYDKIDSQILTDLDNAVKDFASGISNYGTQFQALLENSRSELSKQMISIDDASKQFDSMASKAIDDASKQFDSMASKAAATFTFYSNNTITAQSQKLSSSINNFKTELENLIAGFENDVLIKIKDNIDSKMEVYAKQNHLFKNLLLGSMLFSVIGFSIIIAILNK
jgi:exonuclease VII small subunit